MAYFAVWLAAARPARLPIQEMESAHGRTGVRRTHQAHRFDSEETPIPPSVQRFFAGWEDQPYALREYVRKETYRFNESSEAVCVKACRFWPRTHMCNFVHTVPSGSPHGVRLGRVDGRRRIAPSSRYFESCQARPGLAFQEGKTSSFTTCPVYLSMACRTAGMVALLETPRLRVS